MTLSDNKFLELYHLGYTDKRIADETNVSSTQVRRIRIKLGLKVNKPKHRLDEIFLKLYNQGYNDIDISEKTGVPKSVVQSYRCKLQLPAIGPHKTDSTKIIQLVSKGLSDLEIADILNVSQLTVAKYRQQSGIFYSIRTPWNIIPTEEEFQVILGSLLGDGNLHKYHKNGGSILTIAHCEQQKEYIEYKWNYLKRFVSEIKHYKFTDSRRKNPIYYNYSIHTKSNLAFNNLRQRWYTPKKKINKEDLYKIEPLGLAIWYMDDGNKLDYGATLCTNCFSIEDLEIIQQMFIEKFNIQTHFYEKTHVTYIPSKEFPKFKKLIEPYIIPSMQYKIKCHSKTPLNGETPKKDNPVLNLQEIEENV